MRHGQYVVDAPHRAPPPTSVRGGGATAEGAGVANLIGTGGMGGSGIIPAPAGIQSARAGYAESKANTYAGNALMRLWAIQVNKVCPQGND